MIKEVENFKRQELFNHYHKGNNPFMILTTKVNVTEVVNFCKEHKNFYATMGFLINKTANAIEQFKYRYKDGKIYYCEEVRTNYTQIYDDETIGFFGVPNADTYNEYIEQFIKIQKKFKEDKNFSEENELNEIWLSCIPWISFSSLIPPFNKEVTIPQFIWDKYEKIDDKYYINLMIMIHHGFADGFHVGKFIALLDENIKSFKG